MDGVRLLKSEFEAAPLQFLGQAKDEKQKFELIKPGNKIEDVKYAIKQCSTVYEARKPDSKALKWLRQLSEKMIFYEGVVDVLIQQHPETVSLIWGGMKFLLLGVINHEKTVKGLAKALSEIADALPRVEIRSSLFPTDRMKAAVSNLSADILKFLTRAHKWFSEGSLKRTIHSFTQPFDLRYGDILEDIRRGSYLVKDLAACGQLFELRQVNRNVEDIRDSVLGISRIESALGAVKTRMDSLETSYVEHLEAIAKTTSLISSTTLDTNKQVTDLQFSQIMQSLEGPNLWTPQKALSYLLVNQKRSSQNKARQLSEGFWEFARMRRWARSNQSDISIVKGDFRSRHALKCFSVDVIEQLQLNRIPIIFAIGTSQEGAAAKSMSTKDVLKYLVRQVLDLRRTGQTEKSMSLNAAAFSGSPSEKEWFALLQNLLSGLSGNVYLVMDLELLNGHFETDSGFHWLSAFLDLFKSLGERGALLTIKVLLVSYSPELPFDTSESRYSEFVVPAKTTKLKAQRRKGKVSAVRGRGRQSRFAIKG
ncbi:hypothetical protein KVR01_010478 [Diaporthe batatas]|uniref:uncharacterized protein n=1 Tax=Diaporthe batatas TaxID=748121 RepID=UPI001D056018|nr:uncharacterized protein KVR01_010478 [Diaporthe batatas]KAG8159841.1 hypothetical protein KVR01_010478 [Diaporthe batatas]